MNYNLENSTEHMTVDTNKEIVNTPFLWYAAKGLVSWARGKGPGSLHDERFPEVTHPALHIVRVQCNPEKTAAHAPKSRFQSPIEMVQPVRQPWL